MDFLISAKTLLSSHYFEPISVLDSATLSSSLAAAAAASTDTAAVAPWQQQQDSATSSIAPPDSDFIHLPPSDKLPMEDWDTDFTEPVATQENSLLRYLMGDVDDPAMASLNKVLQIGASASSDLDFVDQPFPGPGEDQFGANFRSTTGPGLPSNPNFKFPPSNNLGLGADEMKPPIFNYQNPSFFFPLSFAHHQEHNNPFMPPHPKRHNPGTQTSFEDTGRRDQQQLQHLLLQQQQQQPHYLQQRPVDELGHGQQQAIVDQLYKVAELVQTGNPVLAQGILARLNHHLSSTGKPFHRAAFYCKEALQLLLHNSTSTQVNLVFKIGAYKSFSEISPLIQFANFTCNQAILEVVEGFDRIHIVDFDIGYGGQWASLMQEIALRTGGAASLKITAITSPSSTHDQLELSLTRGNLIQFASDINIDFELEVKSIDSLNSGSWFHQNENEAIAVNLPVGCLGSYQLSAPLILSFVKQLSPRIVVCVEKGSDRSDLPFANHMIHALQSCSNLLESLDACNVNTDALQKIERFVVQAGIEKMVLGRFRSPEKTQHWRALFLSSGFSPLTFSNFAETQGECVVKRMPVRGFQVEKRHSSLALYWQRKELISASAWRC